MSGSDFSITASGSVSARFQCNGSFVSIDFYADGRQVGRHIALTRNEAIEQGKRVEETGIYEHFPVSGVLLTDVKGFGTRLRLYGENGC
jgi:hypothetical protein